MKTASDIFSKIANEMLDASERSPDVRAAREAFAAAIIKPEVAKQKLSELHRSVSRLNRSYRETKAKHDQLVCEQELLNAMADWLGKSLTLSRAEGSHLHELWKSVCKGKAKSILECPIVPPEVIAVAHSFIIQHDWKSALSEIEDFESGDFRLPYTSCAFEMTLNNARVICICTEDDTKEFAPFVFLNGDWVAFPADDTITGQIRSVCIALDADVAVGDVHRREHFGGAIGGDKDSHYSVVRLANRRKSLPLALRHGAKKKLHFVRGHWRHYEHHKTWIKWHLRGNPDIGFIDKEYCA